jgi:hypothetical protein
MAIVSKCCAEAPDDVVLPNGSFGVFGDVESADMADEKKEEVPSNYWVLATDVVS